jgi:hypothetical protein
MPAIRARHLVARGRFWRGRWCVRVFHLHTLPKLTSRAEFVKQRESEDDHGLPATAGKLPIMRLL